MGYKPQRKTYTLEYTQYPGLVITAGSPELGKVLSPESFTINMTAADPATRIQAFKTFTDHVVTWNIEHPDTDDGNACPRCGLAPDQLMPTTVEMLSCLDVSFVIDILMGWVTTVSRVSLPKGLSMTDGTTDIGTLMRQLGELQNQ